MPYYYYYYYYKTLYSICGRWVKREQTSVGNDTEGAIGMNIGGGGCFSVTLSITNTTWTDTVVNMFIRDEKPGTDVYPICKSAQTHPEK